MPSPTRSMHFQKSSKTIGFLRLISKWPASISKFCAPRAGSKFWPWQICALLSEQKFAFSLRGVHDLGPGKSLSDTVEVPIHKSASSMSSRHAFTRIAIFNNTCIVLQSNQLIPGSKFFFQNFHFLWKAIQPYQKKYNFGKKNRGSRDELIWL